LLTLASVHRTRWQRCHKDDSYLLIKEADLLKPDQSVLLTELASSTDAPIKKLAIMVKRAAQGNIETIPPFAQIVADHTIMQLFDPTWRPSDTASQGKVVSDVVTGTHPSTVHFENLTARQQEVVRLLVNNYSDEQIAGRLSVKAETVRGQISKMQEKIGVITRKDLIVWAIGQGIKPLTEPSLVYSDPHVQQLARCSSCQQGLKPSDTFCRYCGKSVVAAVQPVQVKTGKCSYCFADFIAGDQFCRKCGKTSGSLPLSVQSQGGNTPASIQPPVSNLQPAKNEVEPWSSGKMLLVTFSIGGAILLVDYLLEGKITNSPFWLAVVFFIIGISGAIQNRKQ
jgi:DNA-binding CsgD family transcriptional regulator